MVLFPNFSQSGLLGGRLGRRRALPVMMLGQALEKFPRKLAPAASSFSREWGHRSESTKGRWMNAQFFFIKFNCNVVLSNYLLSYFICNHCISLKENRTVHATISNISPSFLGIILQCIAEVIYSKHLQKALYQWGSNLSLSSQSR